LIIGTAVALLGIVGFWGLVVEALGNWVETSLGLPGRRAMAESAAGTVQWSAFAAGLALMLIAAVMHFHRQRRLSARTTAIALVAIVGSDLWLNARAFWNYSRAPDELFAGDAIKARLHGIRPPFRIWDVEVPNRGVLSVYPGAALMADDISQLFGHHGNEPHAFDLLNGRIGSSLTFRRAGNPRILDLFAVNYLLVQAGPAPDSIPGFRRTLTKVPTSSGYVATLFERELPSPYARLIPAALSAPLDSTITRVLDPAFPADRLVLLDSAMSPAPLSIPTELPSAVPNAVTVDDWVPGAMHLRLTQPATTPAYLVVSENWDRPWRAWVDGRETRVLRGDATLITVPVPAGARAVALRYQSAEYERGKFISLLALLVVLTGLVAPIAVRKLKRPNK
jgi:hypothetical protein